MLSIDYSHAFKRDMKKAKQQGKKFGLLEEILSIIMNFSKLPDKYRNHKLGGNYAGYWELHIQPDWLLIYKVIDDKVLYLARTGSHSELFK